jgi:hypothetical protein
MDFLANSNLGPTDYLTNSNVSLCPKAVLKGILTVTGDRRIWVKSGAKNIDLGLVLVSSNFSRLRQSWSQRVWYRDEIDTCLDSSLVENIAEYRQDLGKIWREHPTYPLYVRTCSSNTYIPPMYRYLMVPDLSFSRWYRSLDWDSQFRLVLVSIKTKVCKNRTTVTSICV